jgi:putative membrane protein
MFRNFFIRVVINAAALAITATIMPGITTPDRLITLVVVAIIFGVVNAIVKPIVIILTLPFTIVTLGLFIFVINGLMLLLTSSLSGGLLAVDGLGTAILGGIVMGIAAMIVEALLKLVGLEEEKPRRERWHNAK